jgi:hypothetical protein
MIHGFANLLSVLLDYYGNFERDKRIEAFIRQAESGGSRTGLNLNGGVVGGMTVTGGPLSPVFPKNPANRGPYETEQCDMAK